MNSKFYKEKQKGVRFLKTEIRKAVLLKLFKMFTPLEYKTRSLVRGEAKFHVGVSK